MASESIKIFGITFNKMDTELIKIQNIPSVTLVLARQTSAIGLNVAIISGGGHYINKKILNQTIELNNR